MKHLLHVSLLVAVCLLIIANGCASRTDRPAAVVQKTYGEPMKMSNQAAMPVAVVLGGVDKFNGQFVRVSGQVSKVCQKKGCWLEMSDASQSGKALFVHFTCPVDGRLIPNDALGKPVVVEGTLEVKEISETDARHIKEEGGAAWSEVEKISGPQKQITLASPSAQIAM